MLRRNTVVFPASLHFFHKRNCNWGLRTALVLFMFYPWFTVKSSTPHGGTQSFQPLAAIHVSAFKASCGAPPPVAMTPVKPRCPPRRVPNKTFQCRHAGYHARTNSGQVAITAEETRDIGGESPRGGFGALVKFG